ncbi:unnamed protein product [Rotaria sordida]|uniref:Uncharacterized protein n=1 Tax=Rotaria sordida TaxID=392033 RepID=A0A815SIN6_9BILA|nr:unnamed protein product [Rotaria sordida]CAF1651436.1 unnamed protein product [Rotaria sordida]
MFKYLCQRHSVITTNKQINQLLLLSFNDLDHTSSNNLFKNFEELNTDNLLSYRQISYDTILISVQSNNTVPLSVNSLFDLLFSCHGLDLTSSLQIQIIYVI